MEGSDMAQNSALLIMILFGLAVVSPTEAGMKGIKICGLAPNVNILVKLSDDTLVRKAVTDNKGNVFIKELHGEHWIFESTSANRKPFRLEITKTTSVSSRIILIDC